MILPKGWKELRIKDIFEFKKGKKVKVIDETTESSIPYITIENLRGEANRKFTNDNNGVMCIPNDLLLVWDGANCGTVGYGLSGFVGSTITRLRKKNVSILESYAYKFLQSKFEYFNTHTTGTTIPHLEKNSVLNLKLPILPIETQKKIVHILEKVEKIEEWRKQSDKLTKDYLISVFLEMFGYPISNPFNWKLIKLSQVGSLARGKSKHRPRNAPELLGGDYPLIQTGDIANCDGYIRNFTQTYSELGLRQSKLWPKGTLCITIAANIALAGILTFDACFPDSVVGFTPKEMVRTEYVQYWLSFLQDMLEATAPKSAQKNINLEILSHLNIPIPPIDLQDKFVSAVRKIRLINEAQKLSGEQINYLFNIIIQKYFKVN